MALLSRFLLALSASLCIARACDCSAPTVNEAKKDAQIVFRGTITAFRDSNNRERFAVFHVSRVWKGKVPQTFEMLAFEESVACLGFWPQFLSVGNDLLVYAFPLGSPPAYFTSFCTRTSLAKDSKDFEKLGRGRAPASK